MAKLIRFDKEMSLEEYVVAEVCTNHGAQTQITVQGLQVVLDSHGLAYRQSTTKKAMLFQLYAHHGDWEKVADELAVGVSVNQYLQAFPFLTKADVKRLEKFDVLKVVGYREFRMYGKYKYAALYDLGQFVAMTEKQMQVYLTEYPKGKRKNTDKG